jgi:hypothetical protein
LLFGGCAAKEQKKRAYYHFRFDIIGIGIEQELPPISGSAAFLLNKPLPYAK